MTGDGGLHERDLAAEPIEQFSKWFTEAVTAGVPEPEAMCVATVNGADPSARVVLLKAFDRRGFVFFTNYTSAKGRDLAANPVAALVWRWYSVRRQVRVAGEVERTSGEDSDTYFASRPRGSQLSAWASAQSTVVPDRAALEARMAAVEARFSAVAEVPRPPWWGGLRVVPHAVEFWQNRDDRLHDRLRYVPDPPGWRVERLSP
jgi:pyridoxamine 5'-phosphate oxidase